MVSALDSGSSGPGRRHLVLFLGKTLNCHSAYLHPGVEMVTGEIKGGWGWVGNPVMDKHPIQGE